MNAAELEARCAKQQAQLDAQTSLLVDQGNLALQLKGELKVREERRAAVRYGTARAEICSGFEELYTSVPLTTDCEKK